jgi:hypothetical protein
MVDTLIIYVFNPWEVPHQKLSLNVSYGCATVGTYCSVRTVKSRKVYVFMEKGDIREISVPSIQFFCEYKAAPK